MSIEDFEGLRRHLPSDFAPVVRAHLAEAHAWLVATADPCHQIARLEVERIRRRLTLIGYDVLDRLDPVAQDCVSFLVCTPEEHQRFLEWIYDRTWATMRRTFVFVPRGREQEILQVARHHVRVQAIAFNEFADFHREFGLLFNWIVYRDAKRPAGKGS